MKQTLALKQTGTSAIAEQTQVPTEACNAPRCSIAYPVRWARLSTDKFPATRFFRSVLICLFSLGVITRHMAYIGRLFAA